MEKRIVKGKTCAVILNFEIYQACPIHMVMTGVHCVTCSKKKNEKERPKEPKVGT